MRMSYLKIFTVAVAATFIAGCSSDDTAALPAERVLTLAPAVKSHAGNETRASYNYLPADYFNINSDAKYADVIVDGVSKTYMYDETGNTLVPKDSDNTHYFPADGSGIDIEVIWPASEQRTVETATGQQNKAEFIISDWLTDEINGAQFVTKLPVSLGHERSKVTFVLGSQLAGEKITALSIGGFDAYCGDETAGDAWLILDPLSDTDVLQEGVHGSFTVEEQAGVFNFTLSGVPTLVAGQNHTITITAQ